MADGSLLFDTKLNTDGVKKGLSSILGITTKAITAASTGLSASAAAAAKVGSNFESGMSLVAATMGMTAEEIASGSEEFERLKAAAKNAGATTQFSATQAAEALNYMALAGYDVDKSIDTLPTVLNLAAAGGMDLASASDMVTDSMSALGDVAGTTNSFVDKMAKTSQKSNTNVQQLGEAILTVGGTAKNLAGGVNEMNTVLGILADNGKKGSEGGTILRNIILSLTAPIDTAAEEMEKLGLEVFDAEGNMRPLNDTFNDLNEILSTMTQGERTQVLNKIFNKTDLVGVDALLSNSGERFDELNGYISDCDGAAANMAETMNSNLSGSITILKSALEGLGIEIYDNMQGSLKSAVSIGNEYIDELSQALKENGVDGIVSAFGNILVDLVGRAADFAPQLIELSIEIISLLGHALVDNAPQILKSVQEIINTILGEIGELCPAISPLTNVLQALTNHLDTILAIAEPLTAAFIGLKAGMEIQSVVQGFQQAQITLALFSMETNGASIAQGLFNGQLSIGEAVTALFTGQMTLAELASAGLAKAQGVLNAVMSANPIAIVVMAIMALIAIFVVLWNKCDWFRQFWIDLWDNICSFFSDTWEAIVDFFTETIPNLINNIGTWFSELPGKIWEWLVNTAVKIVEWQAEIKQKAKDAITGFIDKAVDTITSLPGKIKEWLLNAALKVVEWQLELQQKAKDAIIGLKDKVVDTIKDLPEKIKEAGINVALGFYNGIKEKIEWVKEQVGKFFSGILEGVKEVFDIHSPSRKFGWIAEMCIEGFDQEFDEYNPYDTLSASMKANAGTLKMNYLAGMGNFSQSSSKIDYNKMGEATASAFERAGLKIVIGNKEAGRIMRSFV